MHVAVWYRGTLADQSSPNSGNKCLSARPLTLPNFVTTRQEMCEISAAENLCFHKIEPKFIKMADNLQQTSAPRRAKFHCSRPNDVREKRYKIFSPSVFWHPRGTPLAKVHQSWPWCTARPLYQFAKFYLVLTTRLRDTTCMCCQISSISLMMWPIENSKRHVCAYHAATITHFISTDRVSNATWTKIDDCHKMS